MNNAELTREQDLLLNAQIKNGHVPGHKFSTYICFCKKCNKLITYPFMDQFVKYVGTQCNANEMCNGENNG